MLRLPQTFIELHKYNEKHILFKCKICDILNNEIPIVNWERNRPPDISRCDEIATYIYSKHSVLDWLFYMTYDKITNKFSIIDGIHRYTALQIIKRENSKPPDFICPNTFGQNNDASWLYEKYILISLRIESTLGEQVDLFQSLNKCNPVPELYFENNNQIKREIIEEVVKEWTARFKSHFSPNSKPNSPNINRDRFIEFLDFIYEKYKINKSNSHLLNDTLFEMNNTNRLNIPPKTSAKIIEKCKQTGCYLFIIKLEKLEEDM
jgi:hypothetical protein